MADAQEHGLICAMVTSHSIPVGFNRLENHEKCSAMVKERIDLAAEAGYPNVICFSGNRAGMGDDEGLANSIAGVKKLAPYAEKKKINICLEFLNSHDHKDYMADSTKWCVAFVHGVGSPRVKVLYDIYHAGMMKEDVVKDVKEHADCWGHFHTGGVPGRHEIDDTQTLPYTKIMEAIVCDGLQGLRRPGVHSEAEGRAEELGAGSADLRCVRVGGKLALREQPTYNTRGLFDADIHC